MIARTESLPVLGPRVVNRLPVSALARLFAATDDGHCGILARASARLASTGFAVFLLAVKKSKISVRNIAAPLSPGARTRKPRSFLLPPQKAADSHVMK